ncbi:MAG: phosphoserine phosphatase SerB [Nitrososphaera sp.]|uniref:phosphoserine phosphatase n=1 Tax=Nitrososphaera gargensis (strain Ga9.2) TaxID=1237085 RepID=K0IJ27_NITGG|nr:phosphoserine phosphatase SerB [Candidatus Nitrososphaera gargensis]AFU59113.1 phosphoserine phosphatase SerB [Candidatus Nitrososphaera gargensis Ga9.2]
MLKYNRMLIIFDVEGVLLNAEYLPVLAQVMGPKKEKEIWDITNAGIRGEINWEEGLKRRVHALRGIKYEDAKRLAEGLPLMPGAKELCSALKKAGWKMIAVSGGFTIITDRLKTDLGIDKIFSNELVFKDGKLDDVIMHVTSDKAAAVRGTIKEWGIRKEDIVVVVDGANDLKLFALAGFTVGFCPVDVVREKANETIDKRDLGLLLHLLKKNFGEAVLINAASRRQ